MHVYVYMFVYTYIKLVCISVYFTRFNPVTVVTANNIWGIIFVGSSQTGKWFVFPFFSHLNRFKICSSLQQLLWLNVCWCYVFVTFVSVQSLVTSLVTCKATLKREHEPWSCQIMFCINELYLKLCARCSQKMGNSKSRNVKF